MATVQFGKLEIDPIANPAVLNTGSWDHEALKRQFALLDKAEGGVRTFAAAEARSGGALYQLAEFPDGQSAFVRRGSGAEILQREIAHAGTGRDAIALYPADDGNIALYTGRIQTLKGPRALGAVPRLGIGVRHSTALWPGIWQAMHKGGWQANAIQNSVRELHLLETLTAGEKPRINHLFSVGPVQEGHTGSSFQGLWTAGVLSDLKNGEYLRYGADADHLQIKRGGAGLERTREFIRASRYFTFYTLDVSDILDYRALSSFACADSTDYLDTLLESPGAKADLLHRYRRGFFIAGKRYQFDEALVGRLVGKYWKALDAVEELQRSIEELKAGEPFDLEISIDENPPEFATFETITGEYELLFLLLEIERRGLRVTHLAPNFGVEKCTDYRGDDGYEGLEERVGRLHALTAHFGRILDCHSGDDLSGRTRRIFGRATRGRIHFKVSPHLQKLFGVVASEYHPDFFRFWWEDTLAYVEECAAAGSEFAGNALRRFRRKGDATPDPTEFFFQEYNFATLGKRDEAGRFINRDRFYSLSDEFYSALDERVEEYLLGIAEDLFAESRE